MSEIVLSQAWLARFASCDHLVLGYSGGLDSTVLLHWLASYPSLYPKLLAVHINHGISQHADAWENHCRQFCQQAGVRFVSHKLTQCFTANLEEAARDARYTYFATLLTSQDYLVLGHHQDDQAETVLLHLLRGTGIDGLSGMPAHRPFAHAMLARPLLDYAREDIALYATRHGLSWIEDESNHDCKYSRNFIRQQIMPLLQTKWPRASAHLAKTAAHCSQARDNLNALAQLDSQASLQAGPTLCTKPLKALHANRLRNVLAVWLKSNGVLMPSSRTFDRLLQELLRAPTDATPLVSWGKVQVRRYQDTLYLLTAAPPKPAHACVDWPAFPQPLLLEGHELCIAAQPGEQGFAVPESAHVQVRFRQGGEQLVLQGQRKKLKKLMQAWSIPPWERDSIPLIYINEQLAVVVGYAISDVFYADGGWIVSATCKTNALLLRSPE